MKEKLDIHKNIIQKLDYFLTIKKIPNIIFHGPSGSGKRTIVFSFIDKIYNCDKSLKKNYVMFVNCAQGKGIKFIREELKFFAKTHINYNSGNFFKTIILSNADKLTVDAQSALRRCIELFSHTTRFFIVIEDKYKLLKPILSRFCEIYIPEPIYNGELINLHKYNIDKTFEQTHIYTRHLEWLKNFLLKHFLIINASTVLSDTTNNEIIKLFDISLILYEKGYSGIDILKLLENQKFLDNHLQIEKRYELLVAFNKIKKEIKNEKILILFILNFVFLSSELSLENISFM